MAHPNATSDLTSGPVAASDGIWRIPLPTPFPVGAVNVYLIEDDPLTLIDTGQRDAPARTALERGLAQLGHRVEDLQRIVLSHQHVDHWGLGAELARRSGAELYALTAFADWLSRVPGSIEDESRYMRDTVIRHGGTAGGARFENDAPYGEPPATVRPLRDGDELSFARRSLTVLHRPGHSAWDTALLDERRGVLLGADLLMQRPSTPVLAPPPGGGPADRRPRALARQIESLGSLESLDLSAVLPGHGPVLTEHRTVLAGHLDRYARMIESVHDALGSEPRTGIEIARVTRGEIADRAPFFALCDVLGCLDILIDAGIALETRTNTVNGFHSLRA